MAPFDRSLSRAAMGAGIKSATLAPLASMEWHYARLCSMLTLSIVLGLPLREAGYGGFLFGIVFLYLIYSAACAAGDTRFLRKIYLVLIVPILFIDLKILILGSGDTLALVGGATQVAFLGFAAVSILTHVLRMERVTLDTLLGGICVYLLIGLVFAYLFSIVEVIKAGSFLEGGQLLKPPLGAGHLLGRRPEMTYFSFVTLTTVGYGDITPAASIARVLAMLEALTGQIFLATFLAFLVGNYLAQRQEERAEARSP
jgi:voltage-gated potassium channel Kch